MSEPTTKLPRYARFIGDENDMVRIPAAPESDSPGAKAAAKLVLDDWLRIGRIDEAGHKAAVAQLYKTSEEGDDSA